MGSMQSQEYIAPIINLIDEHDDLIVRISYTFPNFTISSQLDNCICLKYNSVNEIKTIIKEHVRTHLAENKTVQLISNFLPSRDVYTLTDDNMTLLNQKLAVFLNLMMSDMCIMKNV